jgi:hypothetical protein
MTQKEASFAIPDDQDGASITIRVLSPGEEEKIRSKANPIEYQPDETGIGNPKIRLDQAKDRELTAFYSLKDWDNFFEDEAGKKPLKCTPDNKRKMLQNAVIPDGRTLQEFVLECWATHSDKVKADREKERKNSKK